MVSRQRNVISIAVLVTLHAVGLIGLNSGLHDLFLAATPINLVLSLVLVAWCNSQWTGRFALALMLAFGVGMVVEIAGVATGAIFGEYSYGATLGPKLFGVPIVIGFNWALLVLCTAAIASRVNVPNVGKAAIAAGLMVGLDVLMEPVAIQLDFWSWAAAEIPLQNYLAWFVVAFALLLVVFRQQKAVRNPVDEVLFVIQCVFFGALNLLL